MRGILQSFIFGVLMMGIAWADEINLKNGDRLTGKVTYLEGKYLLIKTDYAGLIKVKQDRVASFLIDHPVNIKPSLFESSLVAQSVSFTTESQDATDEEAMLTIVNDHGIEQIPLTNEMSLARIKKNTLNRTRLKYSGSVDVSANIDKDSSKTARYSFAGTFGVRHDLWRHMIKGRFYRKLYNNKTKDYYYNLNYSLDRFITPEFFWQNALNYQHDWVENVREQMSIGTGPGWQVWDNERSSLSLTTLLNYQKINYRDDDHSNNPQMSLKWDFQQYFGGRRFKFMTLGEVGRSFNGTVSLKLNVQSILAYQLTDAISINTGITYEKLLTKDGDSRNKNIQLGIGYTW